jgi:hypothetical protein
VRQLYIKTSQRKTRVQPRISFCKNQKRDLIGETNEIMRRWREYLDEFLNRPGNDEQKQETHDYYKSQ